MGGEHEQGIDHTYTCSILPQNLIVNFECVNKAVHTSIWVERLSQPKISDTIQFHYNVSATQYLGIPKYSVVDVFGTESV